MYLTGIVTDEWNRLLAHCAETGWQCVFSYDMFDKGIDYDLYILERSGEEIRFGWDNWFEGEIKCSPQLRSELEVLLGHALEEGEPSTLKPEVVEIVTGGRFR
ncbi:MAG: hypothetical protein R3F46_01655 [bacterium]